MKCVWSGMRQNARLYLRFEILKLTIRSYSNLHGMLPHFILLYNTERIVNGIRILFFFFNPNTHIHATTTTDQHLISWLNPTLQIINRGLFLYTKKKEKHTLQKYCLIVEFEPCHEIKSFTIETSERDRCDMMVMMSIYYMAEQRIQYFARTSLLVTTTRCNKGLSYSKRTTCSWLSASVLNVCMGSLDDDE